LTQIDEIETLNPRAELADAIAARSVRRVTRALRTGLERDSGNIPQELKEVPAWLVWQVPSIDPTTGKLGKRPMYPRDWRPRHGKQGSPEDRANLGTWRAAGAAFKNAPTLVAGLGFAMLPGCGYVALDIDRCVDAAGNIREDALALTDDTYCEISPSGTGLRAFWRGTALNRKCHERGMELYSRDQFLTVTGDQVDNTYRLLGGDLPTLSDELRAQLESLCTATKTTDTTGGDRLAENAENDPRLQAIHDSGLYERDLGGGRHSILCPFEDCHTDVDRAPGDGDTCYLQPFTGGYATGRIVCLHSHQNTQAEYWESIGYCEAAEGFDDIEDDAPAPNIKPDWQEAQRAACEVLGLPERGTLEDNRQALLDGLKAGGIPTPEQVEAIKASRLLTESELQRITRAADVQQHMVDLHTGGDPFEPLPHVVQQWIPQGEVTLLAGHGGSGKSFVALNLAVHVALGRPFGDLATQQRTVLFISCEDNARVLRQRVAKLCRVEGIDSADLTGRLMLFDGSDLDAALYRETVVEGVKSTDTRFLRTLADVARMLDAGLVIIDNASDAFDGDEIRRAAVRTFIRQLRSHLARPGRAVLLLAHTSKAAAKGGRTEGAEDYSGSSAWHNSVRSRLSLIPKPPLGLCIEHQKANLGPKSHPVDLEWREGVPVVLGAFCEPSDAALAKAAEEKRRDERDQATVLDIIGDFNCRRELVKTAAQGPHSVFNQLRDVPGFPGDTSSSRLMNLLRDLENAGKLCRQTVKDASTDHKPRVGFIAMSAENPPNRLEGVPAVDRSRLGATQTPANAAA
jgi:archaellum biogenesis ATPase FlaH